MNRSSSSKAPTSVFLLVWYGEHASNQWPVTPDMRVLDVYSDRSKAIEAAQMHVNKEYHVPFPLLKEAKGNDPGVYWDIFGWETRNSEVNNAYSYETVLIEEHKLK